MDLHPETVRTNEIMDPICNKQKQLAADMRDELLSCNSMSSPNSVSRSMQNILVMRIYHQIARIIKFTEQMDKIEQKLYDSIDASLENIDTSNVSSLMLLMSIQEKLQKIMIDSQKLLDPYLNIKELTYVEIPQQESSNSFAKSLLDQESREKLRNSAQALLAALSDNSEESDEETSEVSKDE